MRLPLSKSNFGLVSAFVAGILIVSGSQIAIAAFDAVNSDKVDGWHAVGAGATVSARSNKLVATNGSGRLPNNILAKAPDANRLDGLDGAAFQRRVTGTCTPGSVVTAVQANGDVVCATDRINGGDAQTLDGKNSTAFQEAGARTVVVRSGDTAAANGSALRSALAAIPSAGDAAPSDTNGWQLRLEPGLYDIGSTALALRQFVDVQGAGPGATVIQCGCSSNATATSAVVVGASAALRGVTLHNTGGGGNIVAGLYSDTTALVIEDVTVTFDSSSGTVVGMSLQGWTGRMRGVVIDVLPATGASNATGLTVSGGPSTIDTTRVTVSAGLSATAISIGGLSSLFATTASATPGLNGGNPLNVSSGTTTARASSFSGAAVRVGSGAIGRIADSMVANGVSNTGSLTCIGTYNTNFAPVTC
jgi:hypothetical protein